MTGSHRGNDNDDWQSVEQVCPAPLPKASTLRILVFREGTKITAGKYISRFPANQHAVVVTSADWKSSRVSRSCTNKNFAYGPGVRVNTYTPEDGQALTVRMQGCTRRVCGLF